MFTSAIRGPYT
jgi:DNA-binding Lrp family transcriptional regulator